MKRFICIVLTLLCTMSAFSQTAKEIVSQMEENIGTFKFGSGTFISKANIPTENKAKAVRYSKKLSKHSVESKYLMEINKNYRVSVKDETDKSWTIHCKNKINPKYLGFHNEMDLTILKESYKPVSLIRYHNGICETTDIRYGKNSSVSDASKSPSEARPEAGPFPIGN